MNKSTAIFLARDDIRCMSVAYDISGHDHKGKAIPKDIKSFKTADPSIKEDDLVLIPTDSRWGFTVGKVVAADLHVDYDSNEQMRWIVAQVDVTSYEAMLKAEGEMIDIVSEADRGHRREELRAKIFANVDGGKLAAIGFNSDVAQPQAPARSGTEPAERGGSQSGATDTAPVG
jgi:hypothetical protein